MIVDVRKKFLFYVTRTNRQIKVKTLINIYTNAGR